MKPAAATLHVSWIIKHSVFPAVLALLLVFLPAIGPAPAGTSLLENAAAASDPCAPLINAIACENSKPGSPRSEWTVSGAGDSTIQGYGTAISVNVGETEHFKVKTTASAYRIDIYRLGYYQGLGARKIVANIQPSATLPQSQPACQQFSATGLIDCGNWAVSASWAVPTTAVSGVYLARLVRTDNGGASVIPFVVRNDASTSDVVFQTSDETWQAYNTYGGNSLYQCTVACPPGNPQGYKAAFKVSYNRPFNSAADDQGRSWVLYAEQPMIMFMEQNGYDVSYMSGLDVGTRGNLLLNHKTFLSVGHDEYWTGQQRTNVENARDHGVNLAFLSGNEMFWRTRWEPSQAGTTTANRTLVAYKDTHFDAPTDPVEWTGAWVDPRFGTATGGGNPQNALTGQLFLVNSGTTDITVPADYAKLRIWRNTAVAQLTGSQTTTLGAGLGTLGYEWDVDADDGFRPAGLIKMSATTSNVPQLFTDYGTNVAPGTATHNLTLYKAASGALVFGAGTVQWTWGLNNFTTGQNTDLNMQQATVNLFADMGTQPATPMAGIKVTAASTDTTAPTSTITSPSPGSTIADGTTLTIAGTASDAGGGVVGGVEVSTDSGKTWHPAVGTANWSYTWKAVHGFPSTTILSRATDDSGNVETVGSGRSLAVSCPCTLMGAGAAPANPDSGDANATEVGAKFTAEVNGTISAVRFYKATANKGTHVGNVWSASGQKLASVTFTGESASGWQTATFSQPLAVTANTPYVVSYFAPQGHYSQDSGYFYPNPSPMPAGSGSVDSPPLHFNRSTPANPNGFYKYSSSSAFPTDIYQAEYYWVDVVFNPAGAPAPAVSSTTPANNATGAAASTTPTATFNQAVTASSVTFTLKNAAGTTVPGTLGWNAGTTVATFTPDTALAYSTTYTATISGATNSTGQTMAAPYTWSFTTTDAPACPCSVFASTSVPATVSVADSSGVTLGMKFTSSIPGLVTGVRFYKGPNNTGTHSGTLWSSSGNQLATVTFANESGSGWQQANFSSPVSIAANTTYIVSYYAPNGYYSASSNYFVTATVNGPLKGLADGDDGSNGVYRYGSEAFPSNTYNRTNYWVDVAFTASAPPRPSVSSTSPASGAVGFSPQGAVSATFDQYVTASSISVGLKDPAGNAVSGTTSYNSGSYTATFVPTAALNTSTKYTATVSGATNSSGDSMAAPYSWSFTTAAPGACPCSVFNKADTPSVISTNDGNSVQLGMRFRSDVDGTVTGIRFYKSSENLGTHTGFLWNSSGTLLASVTFTNETASGWQEATLSNAVPITAGQGYVVSYYAPNGHYSSSQGYFSTAADNGVLHGLADSGSGGNGLFNYWSTAFPTSTYNSTNYWVDVVFQK